jgi:mercuric ion transport protein
VKRGRVARDAIVTQHENGSRRRRDGRDPGSECCVGPLLFLSVGVGGAWIAHLTALEPYRPVFIVLAVVFLGLAFWKLYLVPQRCGVEDHCVADRTRNSQRILFWILVPMTIGLVASPWTHLSVGMRVCRDPSDRFSGCPEHDLLHVLDHDPQGTGEGARRD